MEAQANTAVAAWTSFAVSVGEQVIGAENVSLALPLTPPDRDGACVQITDGPALRSADTSLGFKGLHDLCAGGLASLTANYFLEKLLVGLRPWPACWHDITNCYAYVIAAGSFADSAH